MSVPEENVPTICFIANVGQRDLQVDGGPLDKRNLREEGQRILDGYAAHKGRIRAPMIEAAFDFIHRQNGSARFGSVLLVATDQTNERFRAGDTITCAEVIQRYLHDRRNALLDKLPALVKVTGTPNQYDRMLEFYRERVAGRRQVDGDPVYVLCSGGTPACNTALLLSAVERFRERCVVLNVSEENTTVVPLAIGRQLLDTYRAEGLERLLERYDFAGVAALPGAHENVRALARAASARMNLDFATGLDELIRLRDSAPSWPEVFERVYMDLAHLERGDKRSVLREVYWNAWQKWNASAWADFLGRVWRLQEASLNVVVGRLCNIDFDADSSGPDFRSFLRSRPALNDYLAKTLCPRNAEQWRVEVNNKVLTETLRWFVNHPKETPTDALRDGARKVFDAVTLLDKARALRNKSVIAHGFEGLSKESILDQLACTEEELFARLVALLEAQGIAVGNNPYEQFASLIRHVSKASS